MEFEKKPIIICLGLDEKIIQIIGSHLGYKYQIVHVNHEFSIQQLDSYDNISLFIINTDLIWTEIVNLTLELKHSKKYENIPYIGLALKKHINKTSEKTLALFEDIILMPCNYEDLLTRIEVWIHTSELINKKQVKSYECEIDPVELNDDDI